MLNTDELDPTIRKLVMGLRQVATDLIGRGERDVECASEQHGFDLEAMPQYADRINGFATELAQAIGYVEPSPELTTAREMAAKVLERTGTSRFTDMVRQATATAIRNGEHDKLDIVQDMLGAVYAGRALSEADHRRARIAEMLQPPARPTPADRLTITIDGPQGSGKTTIAEYLVGMGEMARRPYCTVSYIPAIIEMREGRRFDVRNEVFLDPTEAARG